MSTEKDRRDEISRVESVLGNVIRISCDQIDGFEKILGDVANTSAASVDAKKLDQIFQQLHKVSKRSSDEIAKLAGKMNQVFEN